MIITKTTRIFQLSEDIQKNITKDVRKALKDYTDMSTYFDMVSEALESRLCDLEELMDISKYVV